MRADITAQQLYHNPSLMSFFFRDQAKETLEELIDRADCSQESVLENPEAVLERIDCVEDEVDEFEENCYSMTVEELANMYNIPLLQPEEDEEEDEED